MTDLPIGLRPFTFQRRIGDDIVPITVRAPTLAAAKPMVEDAAARRREAVAR